MKLEYLATSSPDCPLIRLYDFTHEEALGLQAALLELASRQSDRVDVHGLPFVEVVDDCRLTLVLGRWDQSIVLVAGTTGFECRFTSDTWLRIAGLVEPFANGADGFQWLADLPGEASLLLSVRGDW